MSSVSDTPVTWDQVRRIWRRQRRKAFLFFVSVLVLAVVALYVWPPTYISEARLFVRLGRESVALDPTATTGQIISLNESREAEINSDLELLQNRELMERVVDAIGAAAILSDEPSEAGSESAPGWMARAIGAIGLLKDRLDPHGPISARERAVIKLGRSMEASIPNKSTVIELRCKAGDPKLAKKIVDAWVRLYIEEHTRLNRTAGSYDFFVEQVQESAAALEDAEQAVRDAKNRMQLASVDGQRRILEAQISAVESGLLSNQAALAAAEAKAAAMKNSLSDLPSLILTEETEGINNLAADNMRQQLYDLQIREEELESKYTADHPDVVALREQVERARRILDAEPQARTETKSAVNPTRQPLEVDFLAEQAGVAALRAEAEKLQTQRKAVLAKLERLNADEVLLARLEREAGLAAATYRSYRDKQEQARIERALDNERICNVNIAQPASFVEKPISPRKGVVLALALLVATSGAVGVVLLAERLDSSLRTAAEVERRLDVPVVAAVPRTPNHRFLSDGRPASRGQSGSAAAPSVDRLDA